MLAEHVAPNEVTVPLRPTHGKVLAKGLPRMTRFRPGASRFTIMDPSGNSIIFIQRDEPAELEYGGAKTLRGLARALHNARIVREFKHDDRAAFWLHRLDLTAVERGQVVSSVADPHAARRLPALSPGRPVL